MRGHPDSDFILGILGILFYVVLAAVVIAVWFPDFGTDAGEWLGGLVPTGSSVAQAVCWVLGTLMVMAVLTAVYFNTGLAGRRQASGAHGFLGVLIGFTVLLFTAAYLYAAGLKFSVAVLGGIAASVLGKLLFAYWRTRLTGGAGAAQGGVRILYRRVER